MFSSPDHWRSHKPGSVVSLFNTNTSVTFTQIELKKTKCQKKSSFVLKQCFWCELIKTSDFPRVLAVMEVPGQKRIHRWHASDWTDMWSQNLRRLWMVQKGTAVYFYWSGTRGLWSDFSGSTDPGLHLASPSDPLTPFLLSVSELRFNYSSSFWNYS